MDSKSSGFEVNIYSEQQDKFFSILFFNLDNLYKNGSNSDK